MTLAADEFIRRFLLHVLPKGFHRIRHYGLLASAACKANIARARELIAAPVPPTRAGNERDDTDQADGAAADRRPPCPCCGGRMIIIEIFERGGMPRGPPSPKAAVPEPEAMIILIASLHHSSAGTYRFPAPHPFHPGARERCHNITDAVQDQAAKCGSGGQFAIIGSVPLSATTRTNHPSPRPPPDQIPIDGKPLAASRGFLPRRLSDAGPQRRPIAHVGRHPKPFTKPDVGQTTPSAKSGWGLTPDTIRPEPHLGLVSG